MWISAIKIFKNIGFSQIVGVSLVVQQVAVQDILVGRQAAPTLMLEKVLQEKPTNSLRKRGIEESLSQIDLLDKVAKTDFKNALLSKDFTDVVDTFDDLDPYTPSKPAPTSSSALSGTLASVFNGSGNSASSTNPVVFPAPSPLNPPSPDGSSARDPSSGGPLGFSKNKDKNNNASGSDNNELSDSLNLTSKNNENPQPIDLSGGNDSSENTTEESGDVIDGEDQDGDGDGDDEVDTFLHLGVVALYEDSQFKQLINDQDILSLDPTKSYSIIVEVDEDFGSVEFILGNLDTGEEAHQALENQLPFALNSDTRNGEVITAFDFEEGRMQLDLKAFNQNGRGGDIVDVRTLRFTIEFQTN